MPLYQIWVEGYGEPDQRTPAEFLGECRAPDFGTACREICGRNGWKLKHSHEGKSTTYYLNESRLYDNEASARRRLG